MKIVTDGVNYANLVHTYVSLDQFDEAKATIQEAESRHIEAPYMYFDAYFIGLHEKNAAAMETALSRLSKIPGYEDQALQLQASTAAYRGQMKASTELTRRSVDGARRVDAKDRASLAQALLALHLQFVGNWLRQLPPCGKRSLFPTIAPQEA